MNKATPIWNGGEGDAAKSAARIMPGIERRKTTLSFIEDHERAEAQGLQDEQFVKMCGKKFTGRPCGYMVVVKLYLRPEELSTVTDIDGKTQKILLPEMILAEDKFQTNIGLVIAIGPGAFKNADGSSRYHGPDEPYRVSDWILFPRSDIIRIDYRGVALGLLKDDRGLMVIDEPADYRIGYLSSQT